jgi:hypothetical protein
MIEGLRQPNDPPPVSIDVLVLTGPAPRYWQIGYHDGEFFRVEDEGMSWKIGDVVGWLPLPPTE